MNLHLFSKSFIKQMSLLGTAALLAYPQVVSAEGATSESGIVNVVQQTTIEAKGVVSDATGMTVIGASVIEKGNPSNGTITDIDGNFTLKVPENATLVISYIGYVTQEVQVTPGKILNITLHEDNEMLDEVVVVGYAVQKKVNLTGSVSTVQGQDLEFRPVADATQSLQGLVPGLLVSNNSGGLPGSSATLQLRGQGNLSGSGTPYVLVDGVEMNLSDVNPNDIENISVLKDASAASIYGARAAYGVILVTTKKGEEGKMRVSYQGTVGWSSPTKLPEMANAVEFANYFNAACRNAGVNEQYSAEKIALLEQYMRDPGSVDPWAELTPGQSLVAAFENSALGVGNTDYFDLHYKNTAFKQNHNLSLSGGGKAAQYYISGGFYSEDGILRYADMNFKRFNFNANITSQLTDWLKLKVNTKFLNSDNTSPFGSGALGYGFFHNLARFRPTLSVVDPNGHFTELSMIPYLQSGTEANTERNALTLTGGLEITPLKDWHIFYDYTYRYRTTDYDATLIAPDIPRADNVTFDKGTRSELGVIPGGSYTRYNTSNKYQSVNLYSNYTFSLNDAHNFTVMAGYQEEKYDYKYLSYSADDLISPSNPNLSLTTGDNVVGDTRYAWATRGFFGRINYDYKSRYLLEVNGRYDGSSRFAKDHRWGFFPSVSVGWNITQEAFMEKTTDWLSNLKLRLSWGLLGNQSGAAYYTFASTMSSTTLGSWFFENGRDGIIYAPSVVDSNVTWEKVESKNIGLDFSFFNNTLYGTIDFFQRDTKDMLGPTADLADFFGAAVPQTNNARMRNRGWEVTLGYRGKIGDDIQYTLGGSLSDATAEVTEYFNEGRTDPAGRWYKGRKVGEIWGYRASGIIQTQEEADEYNKLDLSYISGQPWKPGDVKYVDLNGDNKIDRGGNRLDGDNGQWDMGDQTIIGNTTPRYQYTFNGSISWKGLSLSMMFQGVGKRDWNPGSGSVYFWGSSSFAQVTVFKQHLDYWTPENTDAYYPNPYTAAAGAIGQFRNKTSQTCDRYLQNAAYCRLKNLTISYDLPKAWVNKVGLNKVQVFFSGENLLTFTKLADMFDPEGIFTSNSYTSESGKNYPMNKVYSIGVVVNL